MLQVGRWLCGGAWADRADAAAGDGGRSPEAAAAVWADRSQVRQLPYDEVGATVTCQHSGLTVTVSPLII